MIAMPHNGPNRQPSARRMVTRFLFCGTAILAVFFDCGTGEDARTTIKLSHYCQADLVSPPRVFLRTCLSGFPMIYLWPPLTI